MQGEATTPNPTINVMDQDWKMAIAGRVRCVLKLDGTDVCQCRSLDEAFITAFCMYFVFNIAYPTCLKKTLTFLQLRIANIKEEGDKAIPTTILRAINALCPANN